MKLASTLALSIGLATLSLGLAPNTADASPGSAPYFAPSPAELGKKILAEVDRRATTINLRYQVSMAVYHSDALAQTLQFDMWLKGADKQLMVFKAPGDVAGMKVLMADGQLWTYLPDFKKARKVATHVKSQGFLGSAFHYEDQEMVVLSPVYDAVFKGKKGNDTTLELTAKPGKELNYPKLDVVIDATKGGVTEIRYYDGAGNHVRTQTRENWITIEGHQMPTTIKMSDLKNGDMSQITISNIVVEQDLDDEMFSRRMLLRG